MHAGYPWDLLRTPAPNVRYVAVSSERRDELRAVWAGDVGQIDVIPNGLDLAHFLRLSVRIRTLAQRLNLFKVDVVLLLPVRITRRKNIQFAIRAVGALKQQGMSVRLLVSGPQAPHHPGRSTTYLTELLALRAELGLDNDVVFIAHDTGETLTESEVSELYALSDCLFFPSESEGFGLPILEAGIAGLPVILSDIPVFREVGGDDAAYFSLHDSPGVVVETIVRTLQSPAARLRRRVRQNYGWCDIADRYLLPLISGTSPLGEG
jgi:glycosyltransferase involved in cell wall biosynthesis